MRQKHADLIIAWANDPSLQFQLKTDLGVWVDVNKVPDWCPSVEYRIKPKVWSPAHGQYHINRVGTVEVGGNKPMAEFGMSRPTGEAADKAAQEMRVHHRLLAYRDEFAPGYGSATQERGYYVFRDGKTYGVGDHYGVIAIGMVYFPREVAVELARKLNEGEVVL